MKRLRRTLCLVFAVLVMVLVPALALAGPRSGGSFSGRSGFRSGGGISRSYSPGRSSWGGGGTSFFFLPSWGWGGYGMGGGLLTSLILFGVVGLGTVALVRAVRRAQRRGTGQWSDDEEVDTEASFVAKVQVGLGRSGRGIQQRLADFASQGDTSSEGGLADLLRQTALELLREKDSIRYGYAESSGPMSLTNGETKMNALALAERSRFQVERIRGADGHIRRAEDPATVGKEALEYLVITLVIATRRPLSGVGEITDRATLERILSELGAVTPETLLGLEVVWTPADPDDSLTETDLMTTYPELRNL